MYIQVQYVYSFIAGTKQKKMRIQLVFRKFLQLTEEFYIEGELKTIPSYWFSHVYYFLIVTHGKNYAFSMRYYHKIVHM